MKVKTIVAGVVAVVVLIALFAATKLTSFYRNPEDEEERETSRREAYLPKDGEETLIDLVPREVEMLRVTDRSNELIFQRDRDEGEDWVLVSPELPLQSAFETSSYVRHMLDLKGYPIQDLPRVDGHDFDTVRKMLDDPRFTIELETAAGQTEFLYLVPGDIQTGSCYVRDGARKRYWSVPSLMRWMGKEACDFLKKEVSSIPLDAVNKFTLERQRDGLQLQAVRITNPETAESVKKAVSGEEGREAEKSSQRAGSSTAVAQGSAHQDGTEDLDRSARDENGSRSPSLTVTTSTSKPAFIELKTESKPTDWQVTSPIEIHGNGYNLTALLQELLSIQPRYFVTLGVDHFPLYGLDHPMVVCHYQGVDLNGKVQDETLLLGNQTGEDLVYAYSSHLNAVFVCNRGGIQLSRMQLIEMIDRYPVRIPITSLKSIDILTPLGEDTITRVESWPDEKATDEGDGEKTESKAAEGEKIEAMPGEKEGQEPPASPSSPDQPSLGPVLIGGAEGGSGLTASTTRSMSGQAIEQSKSGQVAEQSPVIYYYNGKPVRPDDKAGTEYVKQLYRSITNLQIRDIDLQNPVDETPDYRVSLTYIDQDQTQKHLELAFSNRDSSSLYLFVDGRYTGTYFDRDALVRDELGNDGIMVAIKRMDDWAAHEKDQARPLQEQQSQEQPSQARPPQEQPSIDHRATP